MLGEIKYLRGMSDFVIDSRNTNRYGLLVKENLGYTMYCFSTPIYNSSTRKLVCLNFEQSATGYLFRGSNSTVYISDCQFVLENREGKATVVFEERIATQDSLRSNIVVIPTLNGIKVVAKCKNLTIKLRAEAEYESIRSSTTCFSVMKERFKPFLSVAALYVADKSGDISPLELKYRQIDSQWYELDFSHEIVDGAISFEVNLYEPKLFQDTTVQSSHPDTNNAYGAVAFLGTTEQLGEEWLLSRFDPSKVPELAARHINEILLHIPILGNSSENVNVFTPVSRFCSFGSTWNKRIDTKRNMLSSNNDGRYISIDVTDIYTNRLESVFTHNEGLIVKKKKGKDDFIAISTGDCFSFPQILEIKFQ